MNAVSAVAVLPGSVLIYKANSAQHNVHCMFGGIQVKGYKKLQDDWHPPGTAVKNVFDEQE